MQRPWFRRQTWSWYVEVDGKQHNLGKHTYAEAPRPGKRGWSPPPEIDRAWREFCGRQAAAIPGATDGPRQDRTVAEICHRFLAAARGHIGQDTGDSYRYYLQDFLDRHPGLVVAAITRDLVRNWLDARRPRAWGVSSHRGAITALKRALNWAVEAQLLAHNPIDKLKKPKARRRKKVMDAAERADILAFWPEGDPFRDFLVAIAESGCRPGEVMKVTAADVDLAAGTWVLRGTDIEATGELRTIYLTPALSELTRRLVARNPTGPLFRNQDGRPWTRHAISNRFNRKKRLKRSRPIDAGVTAYAYRHSFITDALANGLPEKVVAELVGHRSTAMMANYAHLDAKEELLRRAAAAAVRSGDAPTTGRPPAAGGGVGGGPPPGA